MNLQLENLNFTEENFAKLMKENAKLQKAITSLENLISIYAEQIRLSKIKTFGRKSEASGQLELDLSLVFDETAEAKESEAETEEETSATESITYTRKKSVGRKLDTSKLPREIIMHDLSETDKCCNNCGSQLEKFGEDRSEQLEHIPAQLKVIEHVCSKYTCRCCETVKTAAKPESPLPKSMATPSLITEVILKKYEHHLPWYRQAKIFAQNGLDIPANTICNWFLSAGEILEPLNTALKEQINNTNVIQADETPVKVLQDNLRGYMWGYHSLKPDNRFILFEYNESRSGKVASDMLENYQGILQTDGYGGYNNLKTKNGIISLGCWAHCRRHFADVVKITSSNGKAHEIIKWIAKLYQIESTAREQKLDFAARQILRQTQAPPILKEIHDRLTNTTSPPKSAIGKAVTYALNHWEYLIRYVDHGDAEIDNNLIENQIRPFAIGKKNWMFIGNERAAKTAAFFYSIIQTCRLNEIDPRKYLIYALYQAGRMRRNEVDPRDLLPQFIDRSLIA